MPALAAHLFDAYSLHGECSFDYLPVLGIQARHAFSRPRIWSSIDVLGSRTPITNLIRLRLRQIFKAQSF
jgi:hypothetical protein